MEYFIQSLYLVILVLGASIVGLAIGWLNHHRRLNRSWKQTQSLINRLCQSDPTAEQLYQAVINCDEELANARYANRRMASERLAVAVRQWRNYVNSAPVPGASTEDHFGFGLRPSMEQLQG